MFDNAKAAYALASIAGVDPEVAGPALFERDFIRRFCRGEFTPDEYRREACRRMGCARPIPRKIFMRAFSDIFVPNAPVLWLWRRLRENGVALVAVSNIEAPRHEWLERMGIMDAFDHAVVSYAEGLFKPSRELMVRALDRAGAKAEETFFVDDIPENLVPAAKLGIRCHRYRGVATLVEALDRHGL